MRRLLQNSIALLVVVIVLFLVIPIPPFLLDLLLIINISLSILILMITMNISEALEFSIFPSLLLITTLFRLGLNVSTTRQILWHGYAGTVIQNFGNLITGGNIVVGVVIFLIIVLVQFIVITKGAERVAEGKQPICVEACPLRALDFGDIEELRAAYGDVAELAPLPAASETSPNLVITLPATAKPSGDATGAVLNPREIS